MGRGVRTCAPIGRRCKGDALGRPIGSRGGGASHGARVPPTARIRASPKRQRAWQDGRGGACEGGAPAQDPPCCPPPRFPANRPPASPCVQRTAATSACRSVTGTGRAHVLFHRLVKRELGERQSPPPKAQTSQKAGPSPPSRDPPL